jgi:hypothetical protein
MVYCTKPIEKHVKKGVITGYIKLDSVPIPETILITSMGRQIRPVAISHNILYFSEDQFFQYEVQESIFKKTNGQLFRLEVIIKYQEKTEF